ncbi:MAG: TMEM165/GDT1 family protein [Clostridia bacterium]|nr:TMEM165/GDT1 family protein [Clostridia bacterium]MCL6521217.1 TMEM165/GDT1 family protein [Bacillota bacterium]
MGVRWAAVDWRLLLSTFGVVLVAELGDKTQLSVLLLSAQSRSPLAVFLGAAAALVVDAAAGAAAGGWLGRAVPERLLQLAAGAAFLVLGGGLVVRGLLR